MPIPLSPAVQAAQKESQLEGRGPGANITWVQQADGSVKPMTSAQMQAAQVGRDERASETGTQAAEFALQREKERWELEKKGAQDSKKMTEQFLTQWGVGMDSLKDIYKNILGGDGGTTSAGAGGGAFGGLNDLVSKMTTEYEDYKTTYKPLETEALGAAREEMGIRRGLAGKLSDLSEADYEGASGRAMADVAGQSEIARQAESREQMRLGIDPTSGRFGSLTRRSRLEEAKNKALVSNVARRGEKERVAGVVGMGLQTIDPSKSAGIASGIRGQGANLLSAAAQLKESGIKTQAGIRKTTADIAGSFSRDVVSPYGQLGFTMMGMGGGGGIPTPKATTPAAGIPTPATKAPAGVSTKSPLARVSPALAKKSPALAKVSPALSR